MSQALVGGIDTFDITHKEILDNYKGRSGKFIKGFLINTKRNKNGWKVDWQSILDNASDFINHPGIRFFDAGEPDHTGGGTYKENMSIQETYRVVNIVDVIPDETTQTLNYVGEIIDEAFEKEWDAGKINKTSPAIWPEEMETVGTMENGRPMLDVSKWRALHQAYIDEPAYEEAAVTISTCDGDGTACKVSLGAKTITEKSIAMFANDNLAPLQEIPLIRKHLQSTLTPCEIKKQTEELAASTDDNDYLAKNYKAIAALNPHLELDWKLAAAHAFSKKEGIAELIKNNS